MTIDLSTIHLDADTPEHLYSQLGKELRMLLERSPDYAGHPLPSLRTMARTFGLNRATVHKAVDLLVQEGVLRHASPRLYRINAQNHRHTILPFPTIGIITTTQVGTLLSRSKLMTIRILAGIIDAATSNHYSTIMLSPPGTDQSTEAINAFCQEATQRLSGIIHLGGRNTCQDRPLATLMKNTLIPQVMIGAKPDLSHIGYVDFDLTNGAEAMATRLQQMKRYDVGIIAYKNQLDVEIRDCLLSYLTHRRPKFLRDILLKRGFNCDERFNCYNCHSFATTFDALKQKQQQKQLPACFWCHNDQIAMWTVKALKKLDINVPQDISVVGVDGSLDNKQEALTTIRLPFYELGKQAVLSLLDIAQNGITPENRIVNLNTDLILGKTLTYNSSTGNQATKGTLE